MATIDPISGNGYNKPEEPVKDVTAQLNNYSVVSKNEETPDKTDEKEDKKSNQDDMEAKDVPAFGDSLTERKIPDSDETVADRAAKDFVESIKKDIKDGKLKEDSDEANLVKLFEAKAAAENGYELHGYIEDIQSGNTTYRQSDVDPTKLTGKDVKDIVDSDKVDEKIAELMSKDGISDRYNEKLDGSIKKLASKDLDEIKDKINSELFEDGSDEPNTNFEKYILSLYEKGDDESKDKAEAETDKYFEALQLLEPDKYVDRRQTFNSLMVTHEINEKMSDPGSISAEDKSSAAADTFALIKGGINSIIGSAKNANGVDDAMKKLLDDVGILQDTTKTLGPEAGAKFNDAIREAAASDKPDYDKIVDKAVKDLGDDRAKTAGTLKRFLTSASSNGYMGAISGTLNLATAIKSLAGGDLTADEQMAAARNLIGGLGGVKDFATFGSTIVEKLGGTVPGDVEGETKPKINAKDWLGIFDDNFDDIWKGEKSDDPLSKSIRQNVNTASDAIELQEIVPDAPDGVNERLSNEVAEEVGGAMGADKGEKSGSSKGNAKKVGQSFLRFMSGAGLDVTGGALDLVSGAKKVQKANNALERADAGFTLGGGIATTAQGILSTISMLESKAASFTGGALQSASAGARAATAGARAASAAATAVRAASIVARTAGPVFGAIGAVFGIAGTLIADAVQHNKMQKLTDEQGDFYKALNDMGVAKENWNEKLEYARYATYMYGDRDSPEDKSIFEYQADEWDHFKNTEGEDGSSLNRLAPYLHRDSNLQEKNLFEKYLDGSTTSGSNNWGHRNTNDDHRPWSDTDMDEGADGSHSTNYYFEKNAIRAYDKDFLDKNRTHIETIVDRWDDWNGKDDKVSEKDLKKIVEDSGRSDGEIAAAKFLLENEGFRFAVDAIRERGKSDTKISNKDLNVWLEGVDSGMSV